MRLYPSLRTSFRCWAEDPPDAVRKRLVSALGTQLEGSVGRREFSVSHIVDGSPSVLIMIGSLEPAAGGTLVDARVHLRPEAVGWIALGSVVLGLGYVIGVIGFSAEVNRATGTLFHAAGAEAEGRGVVAILQEAAEPTESGAEADAPQSLAARSDLEGARFTLLSSRGMLDQQREIEVVVAPGRLTVGKVGIPWHDLVVCEAAYGRRGVVLRLTTSERALVVDAGSHAFCDVEWLAAFLEARRSRFAATPEEEAHFREVEAEVSSWSER